MWVLILVSHVLFYQLAASSLQLHCCIFLPRYYHLIIYQRHYSSQCPSHVVCPSRMTDRTSGLTPWAKEPVALPDMRMFVFQVSVGPDQALRGEDHLVSGLLELLQQLFRTRGKNDIVTVPIREKNGNCHCAVQLSEKTNKRGCLYEIPWFFVWRVKLTWLGFMDIKGKNKCVLSAISVALHILAI